MHAFHKEVGADEHLFIGAKVEYGRVIANTLHSLFVCGCDVGGEALNEPKLSY